MAAPARKLSTLVNPLIVTIALALTTAVITVKVEDTTLASRFDRPISDFLFVLRNSLDPDQPISHEITLIGIDDVTSREFGPYGKGPWWITRKAFRDQIPHFRDAFNPTVVAYDIIFKEVRGNQTARAINPSEDGETLDLIAASLRELSADPTTEIRDDRVLGGMTQLSFELGDAILAQSLAALGGAEGLTTEVLLAYYFPEDSNRPWSIEAILGDDPDFFGEDGGTQVPYLRDVRIPLEYVHNLPADFNFSVQAADMPTRAFLDYGQIGYINVPRDEDGLIRRINLVHGLSYSFQDPETKEHVTRKFFVPSFSLLACLNHWGIDLATRHLEGNYLSDGKPVVEVHLGENIIVRPPGRDEVRIPIDENGSFCLDFVGRVQDFDSVSFWWVNATPDDPRVQALLQRRLVMVGITETGNTDVGPCPIDSNTPFVHMHMLAASNILTQTFITPLRIKGTLLVVLLLWLVVTPITIVIRPLQFAVACVVLLIAYLMAAYVSVALHLYLLPVTAPVGFMVLSMFGTLVNYYFSEAREKRKIRGMFSTMVSGDVLQYLEENPESFSLAGQKREATMFFSDVAGFTTISESLDPSQLVELLNQYLSPMTEIVMSYEGYVDKYEGDAIMAEWGVPYPNPDHARLACWAALDQQARLAELRPEFKRDFGVDVSVRMGLNSGVVSAGNMGSARRFSYTVMGDAVNQAARFEPANKDYGTLIMMGESTYQLAKDHVESRLLDKIIVKGKTVPIQIYELIAKKGEASADQLKVVELYHRGLNIHWERRWDEALACFAEALTVNPEDNPSKAMIERINNYKTSPPPETWQGEYVRTSKD